jgi:hypothetical protein
LTCRGDDRSTNKRIWLIVALASTLILLSCVCLEFCPFGNVIQTVKHFENDKISFDYPSNWDTLSETWPRHDEGLNADEVTGVGLPKSPVFVRVYNRELPNGSNLKRVYDETYRNTWISQYVKSHTITESTITVDGVTAYERVYKRPHGEPWYQIMDVWLEKEGRIYVLSCWASPDSFHEAEDEFTLIINSFHVK